MDNNILLLLLYNIYIYLYTLKNNHLIVIPLKIYLHYIMIFCKNFYRKNMKIFYKENYRNN